MDSERRLRPPSRNVSRRRYTSYAPHRTERAQESGQGVSFARRLLVLGAITGLSFFVGRVAGINVEDVPAAVVESVGSAADSILPTEQDYQGPGKLLNTPIEPGVEKQFLTNGFAQTEIPVRSKPGPDEPLVGITLSTYLVNGQEWYGYTYPSDSEVGRFTGPDGKVYGRWFKARAVPLFEKIPSGKYVPVGVAENEFIAENFLTSPEDQNH